MANENDNDPYLSAGGPSNNVPQPGMGDPSSYLPPDPTSPPPVYGSTPIPPPPPPPGYNPAPVFGNTGTAPSPYPVYGTPGNESKNVFGILALVFPFIGLSLVGIVMGHLGLSAVKKGTATNRGVALAGLIVSYVFTALALVYWVIVIIMTVSNDAFYDYDYESDYAYEAVENDLNAIRDEVELYWLDNSTPPVVRVIGEEYLIAGETVPVTVSNPELTYSGDSAATWCVQLESETDPRIASMSAQAGYQPWLDCDTAVAVYGTSEPVDTDAPVPTGEAYVNATKVSLYDLAPGDCMLDPYEAAVYDEATESYTLWDVYLVPCDQTHYGEVSVVADFTDTSYPGTDAVIERLEDICLAAFEDYIGIDYMDSEFYFDYFYPTAGSWAAGDREYTCLVYGTNGVDGSLRGAAR